MVQVVERLPRKCEALTSNSSTTKKRKKFQKSSILPGSQEMELCFNSTPCVYMKFIV
jgi:hypothetical protein